MKRKSPSYLINYVLLANGEEYPHQILILAATSEIAQQRLISDVTLIGTCEIRISNVTLQQTTSL